MPRPVNVVRYEHRRRAILAIRGNDYNLFDDKLGHSSTGNRITVGDPGPLRDFDGGLRFHAHIGKLNE